MKRGQLCRCGDDWYVVVSSDTVNRLLPTCWGLLVDTTEPSLRPPLVFALPAGTAGDHPDLWIRTTQIRTLATAALDPVGTIPAELMSPLDHAIARLAGVALPQHG